MRGELATRPHERSAARVVYADTGYGVERVMGTRGAQQQQQRRKLRELTQQEQILYCSSSSLAPAGDIKSESRGSSPEMRRISAVALDLPCTVLTWHTFT